MKEEVTTKTVTYLHHQEPEILRLAGLNLLSEVEAKRCLKRAVSRVRSNTIKNIGIPGLSFNKIFRSSQGKSCVYLGSYYLKAIVGKFYIKDAASDFEREAEICKSIPNHPNLIQMIDSLKFANNLTHCGVIVFPYYNQCLSDMICDSQFAETETWTIAKGIISGLNSLHKNGMIHCDIKPGNIMINDGHVIIIDLASIVAIGDSVTEHTSSYSLGFDRIPAGPRLDWVCTAVTLFGCVTGRCIVKSIDDLRSHGGTMESNIGQLIVRLCDEDAIEVILDA